MFWNPCIDRLQVFWIPAPTQLILCAWGSRVMSVVGWCTLWSVERLLKVVQTKTFPIKNPSPLWSLLGTSCEWSQESIFTRLRYESPTSSVHLCVLCFVCQLQPAPSDLHAVHVYKCFPSVRNVQGTQSRAQSCFVTKCSREDKPEGDRFT